MRLSKKAQTAENKRIKEFCRFYKSAREKKFYSFSLLSCIRKNPHVMRILINFFAFRRSALYRASNLMVTVPFCMMAKYPLIPLGPPFPQQNFGFVGDPEKTPTRTDRRNLHSFLKVSQRVKNLRRSFLTR